MRAKTATKTRILTLNNGKPMPQLGLGVYQINDKKVEEAVLRALEAGYRHIDTAALYGNEAGVGRAIRKSGIPRDEIFVTTKLFPTNFLWPEAGFSTSIEKLDLDYVDQYLIHWPAPGKNHAWKVLETIYQKGMAKSIGVSNYSIDHLEELLGFAAVKPAVNQVEFHPFLYRKKLLEFCITQNITLVAYSPLNRGKGLDDPLIVRLAKKYGKTPAQIFLRWSVQKGTVVIPKSENKERIIENSEIFDFQIDDNDEKKIDSLTFNVDDEPDNIQ